MQNENFLNEQIDNIENSIGINIKIRTLDGEFQVNASVENRVEELKKRIQDVIIILNKVSKVPTGRQRLIYRGKLLKDSDVLSSYKISDCDVIHLVAKTSERNEEESEMNNESINTERNHNSPFLSLMNRVLGEGGQVSQDRTNTRALLPAIIGRRSRRNHTSREDATNFNTLECKEAIHQNLEFLKNAGDCSNIVSSNNNESFNDTSSHNVVNASVYSGATEKFDLFNFTKRKLKKGQWIDVRDTIDQWLEAQVVDVREDKVYVHYNGWGTRWDEWIDVSSERIKPFRFHTKQVSFSNYQSPYPNIKPDCNVNLTANNIDDQSFFDTFEHIKSSFSLVESMMSEIDSKRIGLQEDEEKFKTQKEIYLLSKNLVPIMDRFGRIMTDVGGYINFNLRNNKLEDLDKKVFSNECLDPSLKHFDQFDQQRIEMEDSMARNTRETGASIISPVNQYDRFIKNQIPMIDTPLTIFNARSAQAHPAVDIYVHTIITPGSSLNRQNGTNTENGTNPTDFIELLTNSRHNNLNSTTTSTQPLGNSNDNLLTENNIEINLEGNTSTRNEPNQSIDIVVEDFVEERSSNGEESNQ